MVLRAAIVLRIMSLDPTAFVSSTLADPGGGPITDRCWYFGVLGNFPKGSTKLYSIHMGLDGVAMSRLRGLYTLKADVSRRYFGVLGNFLKAPPNFTVSTWALTGLPCHDFGVYISTYNIYIYLQTIPLLGVFESVFENLLQSSTLQPHAMSGEDSGILNLEAYMRTFGPLRQSGRAILGSAVPRSFQTFVIEAFCKSVS